MPDQGRRDEGPEEAGISHLLEHLKFRGTARYPFERGVLDALRAFGGTHNAQTSRDATTYWVECLPAHLDAALELLGEVARARRFQGLEVERRVVLDELATSQLADGEVWDLDEVALLDLWPGHPFGAPTQGSAKFVLAVTTEQLEAFAARHCTSDNSALAVVGPLEPEAWRRTHDGPSARRLRCHHLCFSVRCELRFDLWLSVHVSGRLRSRHDPLRAGRFLRPSHLEHRQVLGNLHPALSLGERRKHRPRAPDF